jgi:hypothetical protein
MIYLCTEHRKRSLIMARPIKETPVLKGRDARVFAEKIANPVRISTKEREEAEKIYREVVKITKFAL